MLVGVANTLFGTAVMFLFYNLFHFDYWVSSAANYVFGSILSYILNRFFTFKKNYWVREVRECESTKGTRGTGVRRFLKESLA